jgi:hypothetical protein
MPNAFLSQYETAFETKHSLPNTRHLLLRRLSILGPELIERLPKVPYSG